MLWVSVTPLDGDLALASHWVVMDDHIGIIAMSTLALCMVGIIAHQIWSYKTGRFKPNEPEPGTKQVSRKWIVACVVIWLIVAIPLLNMLYPEFSQSETRSSSPYHPVQYDKCVRVAKRA